MKESVSSSDEAAVLAAAASSNYNQSSALSDAQKKSPVTHHRVQKQNWLWIGDHHSVTASLKSHAQTVNSLCATHLLNEHQGSYLPDHPLA